MKFLESLKPGAIYNKLREDGNSILPSAIAEGLYIGLPLSTAVAGVPEGKFMAVLSGLGCYALCRGLYALYDSYPIFD